MGADNWAICPRCRVTAIKGREAGAKKADKAYGVKSAEDYLQLRAEAEKPLDLGQTLREDYGIGVGMDGLFGVNYSARCTACGFAYEYKYEATAEPVPDEYAYDANGDDPFGYNYRRSGL